MLISVDWLPSYWCPSRRLEVSLTSWKSYCLADEGGRMKTIFRTFSAALLLFLSIDAHAVNSPKLVMEEFMVPAVDPGISLYVRNKHPQGEKKFPGRKNLLNGAGSTYPPSPALHPKLNRPPW